VAWTIEELEEHLLIGSTLVEGSTLSEGEARAVLAGRTVVGHPVREIRELTNYRWATQWLIENCQRFPEISMDVLLGYHARLMDGLADDPGRFKAYSNYTIRSDGKRLDYRDPAHVPNDVAAWIGDFNAPAPDAMAGGAALYAHFQAIHPFTDGNGRIGRVLLAYYLYRQQGVAFRFYARDRLEHLRAIEASDHGELGPLITFITARIAP
jgi:Fic family protein